MDKLLEGRNAVVYGGAGSIGAAVASVFVREGARVFLAGRTRRTLEAVGREVGATGVAVVDAHDEAAVDEHLRDVVSAAGSVDVSFNLVGRGDVQGTPLIDMALDDVLRAPVEGLRTNFLTARAAARHMVKQGSGAILHLNSASAHGAMPGMGSTGPADAAVETFMRYLAAEVGPCGVRVVGIHTAGVAGTLTPEKIGEVNPEAFDPAEVEAMISGMSVLRRTPRLADVAETAAFLASDRAAGLTGTVANVTAGLVLR
jgi:NAD(P)-dependent dehydrogenase (short-subunit alcohol dehydrogenase family)